MSETVLWTNSNPTTAYSGGTVSLNDNISNYEKIRCYFVPSTSVRSPEYYVDCEFITDSTLVAANPIFTICIYAASSKYIVRAITYVSDLSLRISTGWQINAQAVLTTATIPIKICGLK